MTASIWCTIVYQVANGILRARITITKITPTKHVSCNSTSQYSVTKNSLGCIFCIWPLFNLHSHGKLHSVTDHVSADIMVNRLHTSPFCEDHCLNHPHNELSILTSLVSGVECVRHIEAASQILSKVVTALRVRPTNCSRYEQKWNAHGRGPGAISFCVYILYVHISTVHCKEKSPYDWEIAAL